MSWLRLYFFSYKTLERGTSFIRACFAGGWLGLLNHKKIRQLNVSYFEKNPSYSDETYNQQGLFPWEEEAIQRYFSGCRTLLVGAAGGGREMVGLHRLGFKTEGFECSPYLAGKANALLQKENIPARVECVPPDEAPSAQRQWDGILLGWQAYSLISRRSDRVSLLQQLSDRVAMGGPLFLSVDFNDGKGASLKLVRGIANVLRFILRQEPAQAGDFVGPCYHHYFTRQALESELEEGGFKLVCFNTQNYPYAVALRNGSRPQKRYPLP